MAFINDAVLDGGLTVFDTLTDIRVDICTSEPTTFSQATTTDAVSVGNITGLTAGALQNASAGTGRSVVIPAFTTGTITTATTASATHWAVTSVTAGNLLIATGALAASQTVTNGNQFSLDAIEIIIRDALQV